MVNEIFSVISVSSVAKGVFMKTQIELAREGIITAQMETVAEDEQVAPEFVRSMVAEGKIVIPWNHNRKPKAVGIGKGLRTKVNASIGTSSDIVDYGVKRP